MGLAGQGGISWELWGDLGQLSRMTGARLLVGVLVAHRANGTRGGRNGDGRPPFSLLYQNTVLPPLRNGSTKAVCTAALQRPHAYEL